MSSVRVLEGIAYDVRNNSSTGPYSGGGVTFSLGDPPVRITTSGYSISLTEGEYLVVAVKPSILFRLFPGKAWARSDIALAYTSMNLRGEIKTVGYLWTVLCCLLCVCGLGCGYLVTRGLVRGDVVLGDLVWSHLPLMWQSANSAASLIALISIALGFVGFKRLGAAREAVSVLSSNTTVQQAQERSVT